MKIKAVGQNKMLDFENFDEVYQLASQFYEEEEYVKCKKILSKCLSVNLDVDESIMQLMDKVTTVIREKKLIYREPLNNIDEFDCPICVNLLLEPVTTPCGHTFCRECLTRSLYHSNVCPLCRHVLHISSDKAINVMLNNIIKQYFPAEYEERQKDKIHSHTNQNMPLFVLNVVPVPDQVFPLHIFEPRYRSMISRCLEGNKKFGVVWSKEFPDGEIYGTIVEITKSRMFPDGRSVIHTIGRERFKVLNKWECDGYNVGEIDIIEDTLEDIDIEVLELVESAKSQIINKINPAAVEELV
eukprot:TRINITY_DN1497_c0_g1_i1.p1 TRINITY_DN1497_c0_g1~~TRINITY_DN1497_c0_g1_i1.p1  ORF type:complete len:299 (-),score=59.89 TRINITY_DN1497_c0_g1_i1:199-1095(-)